MGEWIAADTTVDKYATVLHGERSIDRYIAIEHDAKSRIGRQWPKASHSCIPGQLEPGVPVVHTPYIHYRRTHLSRRLGGFHAHSMHILCTFTVI